MARSHFTDLKSPLAKALARAAEAGPGLLLAPVWADSVGAPLARQTRPVRFWEGLLTVEGAPEFIAEIERDRETVRRRLNARLGHDAVRRIQFVPR